MKLAEVPIVIPGTGIQVNVDFFLYVDASGQCKLSASIDNRSVIEFNSGRYIAMSDAKSEASLDGTITIEPGLGTRGTVKFFGLSIIDAAFKAGMKAEFEGELQVETELLAIENESKYHVTDNVIWSMNTVINSPIVAIELGTKPTLAKKLGIHYKKTIIGDGAAIYPSVTIDCKTQKNEYPWCQYLTAEWVIYTREYDVDEERVEPPSDNNQNNEIQIGDRLDIDRSVLYLKLDQSEKINVTLLPEGYTINDIVFTIEDSSIAKVDSNGIITALQEGGTKLVVKTNDGLFETECYVNVSGPEKTYDLI